MASAAGRAIPSLGRRFPALSLDADLFFTVKAFAAVVDGPWQKFPFVGLVAMLASIATLVVGTIATRYFQRATHGKKGAAVVGAGDMEVTPAHHAHVNHSHDVLAVVAASKN